MAKPKAIDLEEKLKKQDSENYGDEETGGHNTDPAKDDSAEKALESFTGDKIDWTEDKNIGERVAEDEEDLVGRLDKNEE